MGRKLICQNRPKLCRVVYGNLYNSVNVEEIVSVFFFRKKSGVL